MFANLLGDKWCFSLHFSHKWIWAFSIHIFEGYVYMFYVNSSLFFPPFSIRFWFLQVLTLCSIYCNFSSSLSVVFWPSSVFYHAKSFIFMPPYISIIFFSFESRLCFIACGFWVIISLHEGFRQTGTCFLLLLVWFHFYS